MDGAGEGSTVPSWVQQVLTHQQQQSRIDRDTQQQTNVALLQQLQEMGQAQSRLLRRLDSLENFRTIAGTPPSENSEAGAPSVAAMGKQPVRVGEVGTSRGVDLGSDPSAATTPVYQPKHRMRHPEKYDHKDPALFPQFLGALQAKMDIDALAIGDNKSQMWYVYECLSGSAQGRIFPWMKVNQDKVVDFNLSKLYEHLERSFGDPQKKKKAVWSLNDLKQGHKSIGDLIGQLDRLILEAGAWGLEDVVKIGYLKKSLKPAILRALVGTEEPEDYEGFCSMLRRTENQAAEVEEIERRRTRWNNPARSAPPPTRTRPDTMDWEPTTTRVAQTQTVGSGSGQRRKRAEWVSDQEMRRRVEKKCCFRCGKPGHGSRECDLDPALRPNSSTQRPVRAAPTETQRIEEVSDSESEN
jgi:hypothetical protein